MMNFGGRGGRGGGRGGGGGRFPDSPRDSPMGGRGRGGFRGGGGGGGNSSPFGFQDNDGDPRRESFRGRGNDDGGGMGMGGGGGGGFGGGRSRFDPPFPGGRGGRPDREDDFRMHAPNPGFGPGRDSRDFPPSREYGGRGLLGEMPQPPPTLPPASLSTPHENRTNDVEIIVINKSITEYGEFIERRLKSLAFTVDLLFPNEEVPLPRVLANIASRGTLYAILVTPIHQQHRSLTLNILHGLPQEHRNMPVEDAVCLVSRNYEMYVMQCSEKRGSLKPPEDIRALLDQSLAGDKPLTVSQVEKIILYYTQEKARLEIPGGGNSAPTAAGNAANKGGASLEEQDLQNRILNILNKGNTNSSGGPPTMAGGNQPQGGGMGLPPPAQQKPPLLNDPTVQKALDNLIQGFTPNRVPMNR